MKEGLETVLHEFQLRVFGEELTRVNMLPREQRWAYVRELWRIRRSRHPQAEVLSPERRLLDD